MKKTLLVGLIAAVAISTNAHAWSAVDTYLAMEPQEDIQPIKFRGVAWGTLMDEVISEVITPDMEDEDYYADYEEMYLYVDSYTVAGKEMSAIYNFDPDNEEFHMGTYLSKEKHSNKQQYYLDFLDLQDALTEVYGEMTINDDQWITDTYKGREDMYGIGIAHGNMILCRGWKASDGSAIVLFEAGDNSEINLVIMYFSPYVYFTPNTDGL